jgi:5,10-methylenetetrahydrofolate reductase
MKMHGIEPIMQVVCRDKNRLAIQADIVGASLHGIENICALTGDDVTAGDETEARRVFDLDGPQLVRLATTIGRGEYMSGRKIVGFDLNEIGVSHDEWDENVCARVLYKLCNLLTASNPENA